VYQVLLKEKQIPAITVSYRPYDLTSWSISFKFDSVNVQSESSDLKSIAQEMQIPIYITNSRNVSLFIHLKLYNNKVLHLNKKCRNIYFDWCFSICL